MCLATAYKENLSPENLCMENVLKIESKYNLEYCNNVTNAAGRRVWGFMGIEAVAHIGSTFGNSERTYVPNGWEEL